jgi:polysaccharide biosynthesis protein PslH
MNILQLCHKVPFPPKDGGCIAINNLTTGLTAVGHKVKVLAVNTPKHHTNIGSLPEDYKRMTEIEAVDVDTEIRALDAFVNLFTSESYNISRFYSRDFERRLLELLNSREWDIVLLESLFTSPYTIAIRKHSNAKVVLRAHNVEHMLWERNASESSGLKKKYLRLLARRLKTYETGMLNKFDAIAAITPEDAVKLRQLGCRNPVIHTPFGVNASDYPVSASTSGTPTFFHIGAMDWLPNQLAVQWLLDKMWSRIHERIPSSALHLAGRNMPADLLNSNLPGVSIHGEVEDAIGFMQQHDIMIAPLQTGGGMRIKIIEAMALGKAVITTRLGAEGISGENGKHFIIAESEDGFIDAAARCMNDPALRKELGRNARKLVEEQYDNHRVCERLSRFFEDLRLKQADPD